MNSVIIRNGSFEATLNLEALSGHPIPLTRKLFKQLFSGQDENGKAIATMARWLAENLAAKRQELAKAETDNSLKYADRKTNAAIKQAKTEYAQIYKLQSIFNDFMK